ncbi:MAG: hypothetical protein JKY08_01515 [Flavobacteriaceae bacterium]|nr:hypothetical protein [Flavobacteriaceae bacterium]
MIRIKPYSFFRLKRLKHWKLMARFEMLLELDVLTFFGEGRNTSYELNV